MIGSGPGFKKATECRPASLSQSTGVREVSLSDRADQGRVVAMAHDAESRAYVVLDTDPALTAVLQPSERSRSAMRSMHAR